MTQWIFSIDNYSISFKTKPPLERGYIEFNRVDSHGEWEAVQDEDQVGCYQSAWVAINRQVARNFGRPGVNCGERCSVCLSLQHECNVEYSHTELIIARFSI